MDDDEEGTRNNEPKIEAREVATELVIYAMPDKYVELAKQSDCGWQKIPCLIRMFHIRLPPVPLTDAEFEKSLKKKRSRTEHCRGDCLSHAKEDTRI